MTLDGWITVLVLVGTLALLVTERTSPALAILGADVVLLLLGILDSESALSGFSSSAPFTVAALYVVAAAVEKSGFIQPTLDVLVERAGTTRWGFASLLTPVAGVSAFLNNTPVVAMVTPRVIAVAARQGLPASRYLMPLSFAAILGGLVTVIGTSTTVVVDGLMQAHGMDAMGMFEIGRIGGFVALGGVAFLILFSSRLLRDRTPPRKQFEEQVREFVIQMVVQPGGALDGASVEDAGLRHLQGVFLAEVRRGDDVLAPAAPDTVLRGGDVVVFAGRADMVLDIQSRRGLVSAERDHSLAFHTAGHTYFEAVVGPGSPLAGQTLREADFRRQYQAAVIGIHRSGGPVRAKLGTVRLRPGDTLLLLSDAGFGSRWRHRREFLLVSHFGRMAPGNRREAWAAGLLLVGIVASVATGAVPILHAALAGAILTVVLRILTPNEARRAVDLNVVVLIAAAFGLGTALEVTGVASVLGETIFETFGPLGPRGVLLGVALATLILTELITNNAAAVLVFPVALAAAAEHGIDPRPLCMTVAVAASSSFLTPIGYQTNTMVYGSGGYHFGDFSRLGLPLTVLVLIILVVGVPWIWPL